MSYTTLWAVFRTKATSLQEFRNSHGSASILWDHLCDRYLGGRHWFEIITNDDDSKALWQLVENPEVPENLRLCHAMTFDNAVIRPELRLEAAAAAESVGKLLHDPKRVNHWPAIAHALRSERLDHRAMGFALGCTSVCDPWWEWGKDSGEPWWVDSLIRGATG